MTVQKIREQTLELLNSPHLAQEYMTGISYDELSKIRTFIESLPDDHPADANEIASKITKLIADRMWTDKTQRAIKQIINDSMLAIPDSPKSSDGLDNMTPKKKTEYVVILQAHDGTKHVLNIEKLVPAPKEDLLMIHVEDFRNKGK